MKRKVIAICGKGGTGKTSVAAIITGIFFRDRRFKALIVDADPAGGLCTALKIPVKSSIEDVRKETVAEIKRVVDKRDLLLSADYFLTNAITEIENLSFLWIGRPVDRGCYCKVNSLLRDAIELLAERFPLVIIDGEAGIEQINRNVMSEVNYMLLLSDSSIKGLKVAESIIDTAKRVSGVKSFGLLLNRVKEEEVEKAKSKTWLPVIGWIPEDETVSYFDSNQLSFFDFPSTAPAYESVKNFLKHISIFDKILDK